MIGFAVFGALVMTSGQGGLGIPYSGVAILGIKVNEKYGGDHMLKCLKYANPFTAQQQKLYTSSAMFPTDPLGPYCMSRTINYVTFDRGRWGMYISSLSRVKVCISSSGPPGGCREL